MKTLAMNNEICFLFPHSHSLFALIFLVQKQIQVSDVPVISYFISLCCAANLKEQLHFLTVAPRNCIDLRKCVMSLVLVSFSVWVLSNH